MVQLHVVSSPKFLNFEDFWGISDAYLRFFASSIEKAAQKPDLPTKSLRFSGINWMHRVTESPY